MPAHVVTVGLESSAVEALHSRLTAEGYRASSMDPGETGLSLVVSKSPDLVLLGPRLPFARRLELCCALRRDQQMRSVGIIAVSKAAQEDERIEALSKGADDALTDPFSVPELVARIKAILRRVAPQRTQNVLRYADIALDRAARRVTRGSRTLALTPQQYRLLEALLENLDRVQSLSQLVEAAWGPDAPADERTVVVLITRLRRVLCQGSEADPIRTVRGMGYAIGGF